MRAIYSGRDWFRAMNSAVTSARLTRPAIRSATRTSLIAIRCWMSPSWTASCLFWATVTSTSRSSFGRFHTSSPADSAQDGATAKVVTPARAKAAAVRQRGEDNNRIDTCDISVARGESATGQPARGRRGLVGREASTMPTPVGVGPPTQGGSSGAIGPELRYPANGWITRAEDEDDG